MPRNKNVACIERLAMCCPPHSSNMLLHHDVPHMCHRGGGRDALCMQHASCLLL